MSSLCAGGAIGPVLQIRYVQQPFGELSDLGGVVDRPGPPREPVALVAGGLNAFLLGQRRAVEFVDVRAQLEVAALGGLSAAQFQSVRQARPGDLLASGRGDEAAFVLEQFLAQCSDDEEAREQVGLREVVARVEFDERGDLVVLTGDLPQRACSVSRVRASPSRDMTSCHTRDRRTGPIATTQWPWGPPENNFRIWCRSCR
ncbi:hypothetical protein [Streptomyces yanii]